MFVFGRAFCDSTCPASVLKGASARHGGGSRRKRTKNNAPLVHGHTVEENEGILLANPNIRFYCTIKEFLGDSTKRNIPT
jgi:hypothetical protein